MTFFLDSEKNVRINEKNTRKKEKNNYTNVKRKEGTVELLLISIALKMKRKWDQFVDSISWEEGGGDEWSWCIYLCLSKGRMLRLT